MPSNQRFLIDIGQGLALTIGLPTITTWKNDDRPQKPKPGTFGFNVQKGRLEYWNGTQWLAATMEKA